MHEFWQTNKIIIDETTTWVTYIWIAAYEKCSWDWLYSGTPDTASKIWKIRKIVEWNWITEMFYPDWNHHNVFVWDDRTTYNYI